MGKKRQYRIVQTSEGFFTQIRVKGNFFWGKWYCFTKYNIENYDILLRHPYDSFEEATKYIGYHMNMIYKKSKVKNNEEIINIFEM